MPVKKVKGGYRYGSKGKTYSSKSKAAKQGRAIKASGYKEKGKRKNPKRQAKRQDRTR